MWLFDIVTISKMVDLVLLCLFADEMRQKCRARERQVEGGQAK